jgi:hypothetical protein
MIDDYCLHPNLCGIGQDCSECHQNHVRQLKAEIARLREALMYLADGSTPWLDGYYREAWEAMAAYAKQALQENSDE